MTSSPTTSGAPTRWGALAAVAEDAGAEGLATGSIRITDRCAHLVNDDEAFLLVWDADRVSWSAADRAIQARNHDGTVTTLRDGDEISISGGNMIHAYGDIDSWVSGVDWVAPPDPSCSADHAWWVNDVIEDPEDS